MEKKSNLIYQNSLVFDEIDNNQNLFSESNIYKEFPQGYQLSTSRKITSLRLIQNQPQSNIYTNAENLDCEKKKQKGRVLHLLKNFNQELKLRWNMSDIEVRIHNFLDENQVYITDPMQKQFDFYQKTKNQIISSMLIPNYSSDEDDLANEINKYKDNESQAFGDDINQTLSQKCSEIHNQGDTSLFENEEERDNPDTIVTSKCKEVSQSNASMQTDSISTICSLNSQLSLQQSSIFTKRKQTKKNSIIIHTPQTLVVQNICYEQFYYN